MKTSHLIWPVLVASSALTLPAGAGADDSFLYHLTFSARFGLNIHARFGPRVTPDGALYNYLDGYVLRDINDDFDPYTQVPGAHTVPGGTTSYWGYDNSGRQGGAS